MICFHVADSSLQMLSRECESTPETLLEAYACTMMANINANHPAAGGADTVDAAPLLSKRPSLDLYTYSGLGQIHLLRLDRKQRHTRLLTERVRLQSLSSTFWARNYTVKCMRKSLHRCKRLDSASLTTCLLYSAACSLSSFFLN